MEQHCASLLLPVRAGMGLLAAMQSVGQRALPDQDPRSGPKP